jgi:hypothetical protein
MAATIRAMGRILIGVGLAIAALGALIVVFGRVPWLGRLPGDLSFRVGGTQVYLPLATCLLLSVVLSILLNLFLGRRG